MQTQAEFCFFIRLDYTQLQVEVINIKKKYFHERSSAKLQKQPKIFWWKDNLDAKAAKQFYRIGIETKKRKSLQKNSTLRNKLMFNKIFVY